MRVNGSFQQYTFDELQPIIEKYEYTYELGNISVRELTRNNRVKDVSKHDFFRSVCFNYKEAMNKDFPPKETLLRAVREDFTWLMKDECIGSEEVWDEGLQKRSI